MRFQVLHGKSGVFFSGYSGFRLPLINDRLDISAIFLKGLYNPNIYFIFSSPGRSPGRAIVLPPASVLALAVVLVSAVALAKRLSFYVKVFLCDGKGAVRQAILSL